MPLRVSERQSKEVRGSRNHRIDSSALALTIDA